MKLRQILQPGLRTSMTPESVMALSDERDHWLERLTREHRAGYDMGLETGRRQGYERAMREMELAWRPVSERYSRPGDSYAQVEKRRWKLWGQERTRDTFGQPHPDDRIPLQIEWAAITTIERS